MKHISTLFFVLATSVLFAQTQTHIQANQIQQLSTNCQNCLNKGENMYGCTVTHYNALDSCLNIAYKQLYHKLPKNQQQNLKLEELNWLKTRDQQFKTIERTNTYSGTDGDMMMQSKKNDIVKERVLQLIKQLES